MSRLLQLAAAALIACVAGCAGTPPPEWAADAHAAMQQTVAAALDGRPRVEQDEVARAREQLSRTGRIDLLARAELLRCAAHAARLDDAGCPGFEGHRADADPADRAYADYLAGRLDAADLSLLPAAQQAAARGDAQAPARIDDPLARLVAASTLLRAGRAGPEAVALAVDAASAQGWRAALLAWLQVQKHFALRDGDAALAQRVQRRIDAAAGGAQR